MCASILTGQLYFDTHACIMKVSRRQVPRQPTESPMGTKIAEIAEGIFRLSTYVPQIAEPAGFAFNSFLIRAEQPLLFHTGLHKMFALNRDAVARLMPVESLRWIAFGHYEADEC